MRLQLSLISGIKALSKKNFDSLIFHYNKQIEIFFLSFMLSFEGRTNKLNTYLIVV